MSNESAPLTSSRVVVTMPPCADPDCCVGAEHLPAVHVTGDTYRIDVVPAGTDVGYGDLVIALEADGRLEFVAVTDRRCVASISFATDSRAALNRAVIDLEALGARTAEVSSGMLVCNVFSDEMAHAAVELFRARRLPALFCDHFLHEWHRIDV